MLANIPVELLVLGAVVLPVAFFCVAVLWVNVVDTITAAMDRHPTFKIVVVVLITIGWLRLLHVI